MPNVLISIFLISFPDSSETYTITLPNGTVIENYTITLTFRRAADLTPGMPTAPAKLTSQQRTTQPSPVVQGTTPSIEDAKKRINEQLSQIEEILSNPRNAVVMDMSLLINDILKQNTPQIAGSKNIAEYLYGELYKRFNLPVPGSSKFGVMDLIIENQEGIAGETLVSEDLIGLDLDGTCFRV